MQDSVIWAVAAVNAALLLLVFVVIPKVKGYVSIREEKRASLMREMVFSTKAVAEAQANLVNTMTTLVEAYSKGDRYAEGIMNAFNNVGQTAIRLEATASRLEGAVTRFVDAVVVRPESAFDQLDIPTEEDKDSLYIQQTNADVRLNTEGLPDSGAWGEKKTQTPDFE